MKKLLLILSLCVLPLFVIAQNATQQIQTNEATIQASQQNTLQTTQSVVSTNNIENKTAQNSGILDNIPMSHRIILVISYIILFIIGIKLRISKIFAFLATLPLGGGSGPTGCAAIAIAFLTYSIFLAVIVLYGYFILEEIL